MKYLTQRRGYYHYVRRVPEHVKKFDNRRFIRISLKTADEAEAIKRAHIQNELIEKFWQDVAKNPSEYDKKFAEYQDAITLARAHGFSYKSAIEISTSPISEIVDRISHLDQVDLATDNLEKALLGLHGVPKIPISNALEIYWKLTPDMIAKKSKKQISKWKNPRKKAISNFISAIGDIDVSEINRRHILKFRSWWLEKISIDGLTTASANKDFQHLKSILRAIYLDKNIEIDTDDLFKKIRLKQKKSSRAPFDADYVQNKVLKSLSGLNQDAKFIVMMMADTGARVSEIVGLTASDIFLNVDIPYIHIRPKENRELKTEQSERQIPLVGSALAAAKLMPEGAKRYDNPDSASGLINKYLRTHFLLPDKRQSLYSLRHTFKDRLRDAGAPDEVIDSLMGHITDKPKYGRGHILETKKIWLDKIAFQNG